MPRAQRMHFAPRSRASDPTAFTGSRRDAAIKCGGELQRHHRHARLNAAEKPGIERAGFAFQQAFFHGNPGAAQHGKAAAIHARVRIAHRHHHTGNAGPCQSLTTGRRAAVMGTGFKRDVSRGATRCLTSTAQCFGFRMGPAAGLGPAAAYHAAFLHQNAAYGRVRPGIAQAPPRQGECRAHVKQIIIHRGII